MAGTDLAYFDTDKLSNGDTEAINMLIEKARRLAHGYRNFTNYWLRMLFAARGTRPRRSKAPGPVTTLRSEDPYWRLPPRVPDAEHWE